MRLRLFIFISCFISSAYAAGPVWRVSSDQHDLYLGGTIHLLRSSDFPLPKAYEKAYQQSQLVVFETDIGLSQSNEFRSKMLRALMLPQDQTLNDLLKPQTLVELEAYLKDNQMSLQQLARFKPAMISMTLTLMELKKIGVAEIGVDSFYFKQAQREGKKTLALETVDQQIEFIARMGEGLEDLMILQTLEDNKTMPTLFGDMVTSWRNGDAEGLKLLFIDPMKDEFAPIYESLLIARNRNWLPQIHKFMQTPEIELVLVGSAHLIGPDGLLHSLKKAGYHITQLD